jgi:hypothetical protein
MGTSKGSVTLLSTLTWTTFHRSPLRSIKEPCSGTDLSPSMSRSISSVVGSPLYRNTICLADLMLRAQGAFSKNFRLRRFIQLPLKLFATFLARTMQARVRVIERGFQRMAVNGRPYLAVQTHVPPEDLVVSNSNQVITVLRITDAVQAHVITSALSHNILRVPIQRQPELSANRLTKTGSASREPATLRSNLSRFANYTGFIRAEGAHTANLKVFIHSVMTIQTAMTAAKTINTKKIKFPILRRWWCDLATQEGYSECASPGPS